MSDWTRRIVIVLCLVPGAVFALSLLLEHQAYFWDGTVYRCAIEATLANGNPYRFVGDCADYFLPHTYPYAGTVLLAQIAAVIGSKALTYAYILTYAVGAALFAFVALQLNRAPGVVAGLLLAPGAGVFVSELVSGNIGVPFYGLLVWLTWRSGGNSSAAPVLCAAVAPFKPLYSAYLLQSFVLRRNILVPAIGALLVAAWYAGDALLFPARFEAWLGAALSHANAVPGFGFSMLVRKAGIELGQQTWLFAAYLMWAIAVSILTWRAVSRAPTPLSRAFAAIAGTALLLPRLKEYDCLILVPLTLALWPRIEARERREWLILVGGFAVVLPALLWWLRKAPLLWQHTPELWRAFVDMRWLVQTQGGFLFAAMLAALIWLATRRKASESAG